MGEIFERALPESAFEWTGERLTTATSGQVEIEHIHRYFLARHLCRGLDVLDVASGEGYGSALLAQTACSVVGVELSEQVVIHATAAYVAPNLRFLQGDARNLPLGDASVDAVVSFETLEHFFEHDRFVTEVRRVLRPGGRLILSSPDRDVYSPPGSPANPFHVHELSRRELETLLRPAFAYFHILAQRPIIGSVLVADDDTGASRTLTFERRGLRHFEASRGLPHPPYLIAVASEAPLHLIPNSLFIETSEVGQILSRASVVSGDDVRASPQALEDASQSQARAERAETALVEVRAELARCIEQARKFEDSTGLLLREAGEAAQSQTARVERAEAALVEVRAELARCIEQARKFEDSTGLQLHEAGEVAQSQAARAERAETALVELRSELTRTVAELTTIRAQRDSLRVAFRRHAGSKANAARTVAELTTMRSQLHEALQRQASSQAEAVEWHGRYIALRSRLEAILRRFWILKAARLAPPFLRRFVRVRMLGPGRS